MPISLHYNVDVEASTDRGDRFRFDVAFITTPNGQANVEVISSPLHIQNGPSTVVLGEERHSATINSTTHPTFEDPNFAVVIRAVEEDRSGEVLRNADRRNFATAMRDEVNRRLAAGAFPTNSEFLTASALTPLTDEAGDDDDLIDTVAFVDLDSGSDIYLNRRELIPLPPMRFSGEGAIYAMRGSLIASADIERRKPFLWKTSSAGLGPEQDVLVVPYVAKNPPSDSAYNSVFQASTTKEKLQKMFFGDPEAQNLQDYFREISRGKVSLTDRAGVFVIDPQRAEPISVDYPSENEGAKIRAGVVSGAAAIHSFSSYHPDGPESDRPYTLRNKDVIVVALAAAGNSGGQVGGTDPSPIEMDSNTDLSAALRPVAIGEDPTLPLLAHEMLHGFGPGDMYGPFSVGWNAASMLGPANAMKHPDPMKKIVFGWVDLRIIDVHDLTTSPRIESLLAPNVPVVNDQDQHDSDPIILWDSRLGEDEFFVLEYRNSDVGPTGHYDQALEDWGLAIWHVRKDAGTIPRIPTHIEDVDRARTPSGDDRLRGDGWLGYEQIFAAEDNIIYGVRHDGSMMYYRHTGRGAGTKEFENQGDFFAASDNDWDTFHKVVYAGQGVFYCVRSDGGLTWRRIPYGDALTGEMREPAKSNPVSTGTGWDDFHDIIGGEVGVLYCIKDDGTMVWYRHLDWDTGSPNWASESETLISMDPIWTDFNHIGYGGDGVFIGIRPDGGVSRMRHRDYEEGLRNWTTGWREESILAPGGTTDWTDYHRFFLSRDDGAMYAQKYDGSFVWHKYSNGEWANPGDEFEIQGKQDHYIDWGPDGVLDTQHLDGENEVTGHPVNLYAAPAGTIASKVGFWKPKHGTLPLRWVSQRPVYAKVTVHQADPTAERLSITLQSPTR